MRLALFQPDIPQNVGAAMRLTACLGVSLDVIGPCAFPLSDRSLRRAALDYADSADVRLHDGWTAFLASRAARSRLILMTTRAPTAYFDHAFAADDIVLMGGESAGVPEHVHAAADVRLLIPMRPKLRSINVVTAAAMVLGEALRQTHAFPKATPCPSS